MTRSLFHRLLGVGGIPARWLERLQSEGIVLRDEGIPGSMSLARFRAPGRRYGRRFSTYAGSLVLTRRRFVAFTMYPFFNPLVEIELEDPRLADVTFTRNRKGQLAIAFEAEWFDEDRSGAVEGRFSTPRANEYIAHLVRSRSIRSSASG